MKRVAIALAVGIPLALLIVWIANHTYWAETTMQMPPKGDALVNPFYAVERFAEELGARTAWDGVLTVPPAGSVIVLSTWHWSLSDHRRQALEHWVESGGRLVVDRMLIDPDDEFERWSGIVRSYGRWNESEKSFGADPAESCKTFQEQDDATGSPQRRATSYRMCDLDGFSSLTTSTNSNVVWALRDVSGAQAVRVRAGRGTVTVINTSPFRNKRLFDGDHAELFVAATDLHRGDEVHFLSEDDHPSLVALIWQNGGPVVALTLAIVALLLWRNVIRFGPLAAPHHGARRSLAEQIVGTGRFAVRHGGGGDLHAACVRALEEAAQRRVRSYAALPEDERAAILAHLTGLDRTALAAAIDYRGPRSSHELHRRIALVETARRHIVNEQRRSSHGIR